MAKKKPLPPPPPPVGIEVIDPFTPVVVKVKPLPIPAGAVGGSPKLNGRCPNCEHGIARHRFDTFAGLMWCDTCGPNSGYHALPVPE